MSKIRIRKRGNTYSYNFDISKNPRRMKEKGGFATADEAFEAGAKAYADWKNGNIGIVSERILLQDYLVSWLKNVVKPNVKRTTMQSYSTTVTYRINPHLGHIYLQDLRPRDVDAWMKKLAGLGLSNGTLSNAKVILSTALKYAIYPAELINTNPTTGISVPRTAPKKVIKRSIISPEEFNAIPADSKYYPTIKILYHTGLRISEVLGLTWNDINLTTGMISVARQLAIGGYFDTPKTDNSNRSFYADEVLLAYLRSLKATQATNEIHLGEAYQMIYEDTSNNRGLLVLPKKILPLKHYVHRPLICRLPNGLPYKHSNISHFLRSISINSHSFRHTHATRLIEAGAKPVDVAARLGHADATITQNLYTHDTENMKQETARLFGMVVGK